MKTATLLFALMASSPALFDLEPLSVEIYDLDQDGRADFLVHNEDGTIAIYLDDGGEELTLATGTFGIPSDLIALNVAWMDIDEDEDFDLIVLDAEYSVRIFVNQSGAQFVEDSFALGGGQSNQVIQLSIAELANGAGRTLVLSESERTLYVRGDSNGLSLMSSVPHAASNATPGLMARVLAPTGAVAVSSTCMQSIQDLATGSCIQASSNPVAGQLLPLGAGWMIKPDGSVGLSTLSPKHRLHVKAPWNTQTWGDAIVVAEYVGATVGFGIYNDTQKWDIANLISDNQDRFEIRNSTAGKTGLSIDTQGHLGVATNAPQHLLHVKAPWNTQGWGDAIMVAEYGNDTIGLGIYNDNRKWDLANLVTTTEEIFAIRDSTAGKVRFAIDQDGQVGIGTTSPQSALDVRGRAKVEVLEITGGMDIVENFHTGGVALEAGTVVVIDVTGSGSLIESSSSYDRAVAGVVSGAGGIHPGLALSQTGVDSGETPVAMTGRVHVKASAENGAIRPGDRLTTALLPGHAMKATNRELCDGAVIGKAMSSLDAGAGLVLVLVNLQ